MSNDAIQSGERLRLRLCDSDRLSADDVIGMVDNDLAELIEETSTTDGSYHRHRDPLKADQPGMTTAGILDWSVRFCPLWQMPLEEMSRRLEDKRKTQMYEPVNVLQPWWMEWIGRFVEDKPDWESARAERRKETMAWFTGEKERDEMEAAAKPSDDLRSGVLQFHIHQCNGNYLPPRWPLSPADTALDLEIESLEGTFSSDMNSRKSAASGKPALADVIDRTPAENPHQPSAYCEVHLNDRFVYRTRTKQITPMPYFNAVSERFIRDWRMAKIVFVIRDDRDREHGEYANHGVMRLCLIYRRSYSRLGEYASARRIGRPKSIYSVRCSRQEPIIDELLAGFHLLAVSVGDVSAFLCCGSRSTCSSLPVCLALRLPPLKSSRSPRSTWTSTERSTCR